MSYRLTDRLPDYKLEPPDEPEWCDDCDKELSECYHSEDDPDRAHDERGERND